jgi:hypothetical protein
MLPDHLSSGNQKRFWRGITRALDKTYFDDCGGGRSGSPFPIRFKWTPT